MGKRKSPEKIRGCSVRCPGLRLHDLFKNGRVGSGNLREDFAVELDLALLESVDDLAVGRSELASGGVDANLLERTVVALLQLAANVGVDAGFRGGNFCESDLGFTTPHHALGSGKNVFAALDAVGSAFDSWHRIIWRTA